MSGRWTQAIVLLVLLVGAGTLRAEDPVIVRTSVSPEGTVWVGQRVSVFVHLLTRIELEGSPRFDVPSMDAAILYQLPGAPTFGSETIDGQEYTSRRFEFLLYPRQPGLHTVPAIGVRIETVEDGENVPRTLSSSEPRVNAELPAGVDPGRTLITSPEMTVIERWDSAEWDELRVGDAVRRTVIVRARDVVGLAIPPLPSVEPDGLRLYRDDPVVDDRINRGELIGSRSEILTYMCVRAGTYELPALMYAWWNPRTQRLERRTLEARTIVVEPGPDAEERGETDFDPVGATRTRTTLIVLGAALVVVVSFITGRYWWRRHRHQVHDTERALFRACLDVCRANDALRAWAAYNAWARTSSLGSAIEERALHTALEALQMAIVRRQAWHGDELAAALRRTRAVLLTQRANRRRTVAPLNLA